MAIHRDPKTRSGEAGMTLIELMFAGFVLVVGFMGSLILIFIAISSNNRNKTDTTATMLSQLVIEQINVMPTNTTVATIAISDCVTPNHATADNWSIGITDGGAALDSDNNIDFTQAYASVPDNYKMLYYTCGDVTYDVRWHVTQLSPGLTRMIVVSARQLGSSNNIGLFSPPVSLRTISGP